MISLRSDNGSLDCAIARTGFIQDESIDGDPRRILRTVPMLLRGVQRPLEGPGAKFEGLHWWVDSPNVWISRKLISLNLKRVQIAQCCCCAKIKTLDRKDECEATDHVTYKLTIPTVAEHIESLTVDMHDAEHFVDNFAFYFDAPLALNTRDLIVYNGEDFRVSRTLTSGNPLEFCKVLAQRVPLNRSIA